MHATTKRRRRPARAVTAALMALAMVIVACGDAEDPADDTAAETDTEETDTEETDSEEDPGTDAPEEDAGVISIGVITALTGSQAVLGEEIAGGAEVAAEAINEAGGVAGYTFEVIAEDHAVEPDQAVSAAQKLINSDNVQVILSSFTGPTLAVRSLAAENDIFVLNGGAIGPDLVDQEGLYSTLANASTLYWDLAEYMVNEYDGTTVGVIYSDESAGIETNRALQEEICPEIGCEVIASESSPVGTTDWSGQVERVASSDPDLILTVAYGDDIGYIVRQVRERGIDQPMGIMDWQENAAEIVGDINTDNVIAVLDRFDLEAEDPEAKEFIGHYENFKGVEPGRYAANYYEHVMFVIVELVEAVVERGEDPTERGVLLAELRDRVDEGHGFGSVYGESIVLLPDGTVNKPIGLFRIEDGTVQRFLDL